MAGERWRKGPSGAVSPEVGRGRGGEGVAGAGGREEESVGKEKGEEKMGRPLVLARLASLLSGEWAAAGGLGEHRGRPRGGVPDRGIVGEEGEESHPWLGFVGRVWLVQRKRM